MSEHVTAEAAFGAALTEAIKTAEAIMAMTSETAKDWREAYPVGSECEAMWCGSWHAAIVRDHAPATCVGVEIPGFASGIINRREGDVRPVPPYASGEEFSDAERRALCQEAPRWTDSDVSVYERVTGRHPSMRVSGGYAFNGHEYDRDGLDAVLRSRRDAAKQAEAKREPRVGDVWRAGMSALWRIDSGPALDGLCCAVVVDAGDSTLRVGHTTEELTVFRDVANGNRNGFWLLITAAHEAAAMAAKRPAPSAPPLGEMLKSGFRVGEHVEVHPFDGRYQGQVVAVPSEYHDSRDWVYVQLPQWKVPQATNPADVRRLTPPPAQPEPTVMGTPVRAALEAFRCAGEKPSAPLCPSCRDTPLRVVGEAQDVYRCGHCQWTGNAERLAAARKPEERGGTGLLVCPTKCGMRALLGPHGVYTCPGCGWSGGEQLAAAKREATKPKMRFAVGQRVRLNGGAIVYQVMELSAIGYTVVPCRLAGGQPIAEQRRCVQDRDLSPLPEGT